jgi:uncharacterized protein GlcG (DUF336 family)
LRAVECREFIKAVVEKAAEMGVPISVAVVGPEGHLIAVERMDDAGFITPDTAIAKAYTMAAFRSMSPRFPDGLVIQQWFKERNPQLLTNLAALTNGKIAASGGTAPVFKGNEMVGAYGVSGGTSEQDEVIAQYARAKVGWAQRPESDEPKPTASFSIFPAAGALPWNRLLAKPTNLPGPAASRMTRCCAAPGASATTVSRPARSPPISCARRTPSRISSTSTSRPPKARRAWSRF